MRTSAERQSAWRFVTAERIEVTTQCEDEIDALLHGITLDALFKPETWTQLTAFVRVIPDGVILPSRAQYGDTHDWQVAVNRLHATSQKRTDGLWYALPDVVASVLMTGRIPRVVEAFRLVPHGHLATLTPTQLHGTVPIDSRAQDFFKVVIKERKRLARRVDLSADDRARIGDGLKVLGNVAEAIRAA